MSKRSIGQNTSQNRSVDGSMTQYYSFDSNTDSALGKSGLIEYENPYSTGSIDFNGRVPSKLTETSTEATEHDSREENQRGSLSRSSVSKKKKKNPFNVISETREEYEDDSYYDSNTNHQETKDHRSLPYIIIGNKDNIITRPDQRQKEWIDEADNSLELVKTFHDKSLDDYEQIYEEKKASHQLKVFMHSYVNQEGHRINRTRSEWVIPFTAGAIFKIYL